MKDILFFVVVSLAGILVFGGSAPSQETSPTETSPSTQPVSQHSGRTWKTRSYAKPKKGTAETRESAETSPAAESQPLSLTKTPSPTGQYKTIAYAEGRGCEAEPLEVQGAGYTLRLSFVEGGAEAVCGVGITVSNIRGKETFSKRVSSPWIYLDLPPGGYLIRAKKLDGQTGVISTQVAPGKLQKARIFFK